MYMHSWLISTLGYINTWQWYQDRRYL